MPSRVEAMHDLDEVDEKLTKVFALEKPNAKIIPTLMIVDNEGGDGPHKITLQDRFLPSITNDEQKPERAPHPRLIITVDNGSFAIVGPELANVEILGQMEVMIGVGAPGDEDAGTIVTLAWEFK